MSGGNYQIKDRQKPQVRSERGVLLFPVRLVIVYSARTSSWFIRQNPIRSILKKTCKQEKNSVPHVDPSDSTELKDLFSRTVSYLRLSLTDRCNLKCLYCVPEKDRSQCSPRLDHNDLLSYEELLRVVRVAVSMGISKLRLTGGEPLVRRDIMHFIDQLAEIDNLNDIRITTNGVLLEKFADPLVAAGIRKINISLDTLKPERFERITGVDCFTQVWRGIERAQAVGFFPIKLNTVVMRGINDDELGDFVRMSQETAMQIRFIEFMPIGSSSSWDKKVYMSSDEIMDRIREMGELIPVSKGRADGRPLCSGSGRGQKERSALSVRSVTVSVNTATGCA
ncbi:Molybdenum Cofactor Synthesis C [Candidatus Electrothrix marina]|uniref:Molybdenum Cofactor Synthesis C n=1 Tax=Candidatus Electrothrix marina TaxID=1859130 RepID=A0A444JB33_9BACT|nr:Molybdenum Cofactor Synthesis C [Candidatus Electrothrix marina]